MMLAVIQNANFVEEKIIDYFSFLKEKKILGSSYIFIGNNFSVVSQLVKLINCTESRFYCGQCWSCRRFESLQHPDLKIIEPQPLNIKIEAIREAVKFLSLKSYYSPRKVLLIKEADKLTSESANLFLKTLEEPPANSFIGLCAFKSENILPTLISRCRRIYLPYLKEKKEFEEGVEYNFKFPTSFKNREDFALFLERLIVSLHNQLKNGLCSGQAIEGRTRLPLGKNFKEIAESIEWFLKIYQAYNSVNMNLALNLIKMRLKCN